MDEADVFSYNMKDTGESKFMQFSDDYNNEMYNIIVDKIPDLCFSVYTGGSSKVVHNIMTGNSLLFPNNRGLMRVGLEFFVNLDKRLNKTYGLLSFYDFYRMIDELVKTSKLEKIIYLDVPYWISNSKTDLDGNYSRMFAVLTKNKTENIVYVNFVNKKNENRVMIHSGGNKWHNDLVLQIFPCDDDYNVKCLVPLKLNKIDYSSVEMINDELNKSYVKILLEYQKTIDNDFHRLNKNKKNNDQYRWPYDAR